MLLKILEIVSTILHIVQIQVTLFAKTYLPDEHYKSPVTPPVKLLFA